MSSVEFLQAQYEASRGLGDRSIQSDAMMVIDGFEYLGLLIKSFTWPILTTATEVEGYLPGGQKFWQPGQLETAMQGQIVVTETKAGHAYEALTVLATTKPRDCTLYEGNPTEFVRAIRIRDMFMKLDPAERDAESRSAMTQFSGTMHYQFFGETLPGSAAAASAAGLAALAAKIPV